MGALALNLTLARMLDAADFENDAALVDGILGRAAAEGAGLGDALVIAEIDTDGATCAREAMPVLDHCHVELYGKLLERNV